MKTKNLLILITLFSITESFGASGDVFTFIEKKEPQVVAPAISDNPNGKPAGNVCKKNCDCAVGLACFKENDKAASTCNIPPKDAKLETANCKK